MGQPKRPAAENHVGLNQPSSKSKSVFPSKQGAGFDEGAIVRIKLIQFLTYDEVEFKTGPSLNVIIGPNGTGKSAIVCAVCLGLAGKTSWLGRATDPKDFIKYGAQTGKIEIELFNPYGEQNYIITREISLKSSHWTINRKGATQKAVEELVTKLNIQVGNLCQFLPQDKVVEFAKMSMQELLENTEKSVCRDNLYENHQKLKSARQEARGVEGNLRDMQQELGEMKQRNTRLEQDVKTFNERKTFLEKVEVLKMKKPFLEYQLLQEILERAKSQRDQKVTELNNEKKQAASIQKRFDSVKTEKEGVDREKRDMSKIFLSKTRDIEQQRRNFSNMEEKIEQEKSEFNVKLEEEETRKKTLSALQEQLSGLENQLATMCDANNERDIAKNLEKVAKNLGEVNLQMTGVQTKQEELQMEINNVRREIQGNEARLREIRNVSNRRLETLRTLHQHTYEAVLWLRENTELFKAKIHEPLIVCLNLENPADANLVESHISFNDLRAFVCEDPDDLDLFMRKIRNEQKLRVNAIRAPAKPASSFKPQHPITHYRRYGFERYIQQLFTCPEPVMRYLCVQYNVHRIPVGSQAIKNNIEKISSECPELSNFYAPDVQYSVKRSKYNNSVSRRNTALKESRAFADSVNVEREQELTQKTKESQKLQMAMEAENSDLQKELDGLVRNINELREQKRALIKRKDQRKVLETEIKTKKQKIAFINTKGMKIEEEKERLKAQLRKIVKEKLQYLNKYKDLCKEFIKLTKSRVESSLRQAECMTRFKTAEAELRIARQKFEGLETEVEELKEHAKEVKRKTSEKLSEAKRAASITANEDLEQKLTERGIWQEFLDAPGILADLENEIYSMQARAEAMFMVDEEVVRDYERREKQIEELEQRLATMEQNHQTHHENIAETKRKWSEDLARLISEINKNFSYFFSCLQCCGEITLSVPENPEDYEKYGVCIKVKFRDQESMRELTSHHQSGGERSLSTVLYMLALQELTKCPFRCVDEINQGMDPRNERKVFELVVQTVCKRTRSQYFLLTPKLLPDLDYDENMTVLCVYNGPAMMSHTDWNIEEFITRRGALVD